ncbi:Protein RER1C [Hirschfeldia incana]|nr:Protein RER1C [Hirschfeldia incana]
MESESTVGISASAPPAPPPPATDDLLQSSNAASSPADAAARLIHAVEQRQQHLLDKTVPHVLYRWIACLVVVLIYFVRVYLVEGFYIITYAIGIYLLNLIIAFLSPQEDPEASLGGGTLPTRRSDEYRPFVRRLPEFKFWLSIIRAFVIGFMMTFFEVFDVPVFWPILLFYWVMLFILTMRKQIQHMIKYRYVPFSFGKRKYGKKPAPAESSE